MLVRTVHGKLEIQLNRFKPKENGRVRMIGKLTVPSTVGSQISKMLTGLCFWFWWGFVFGGVFFVRVFYLFSSSGVSSALPRQQKKKKKSLISDSTSKNQSTGGYGVLMGQVWGPGATQAKWLADGKDGSSWEDLSELCSEKRLWILSKCKITPGPYSLVTAWLGLVLFSPRSPPV